MGKLMTLEDGLRRDAVSCPDKVAVICGGETCTYRELWERVLDRSRSFSPGRFVPFRSSQTLDFLVEYFAIHLAGCVAVPLEKGMPDDLLAEWQVKMAQSVVPDGVADVLFTTGTTGRSKGVMVSHAAIVADAENLIDAQGYHHDLTFIINGPLNHIGSLSKVYPVILVGGTLHVIDGMKDLNAFFAAMDDAADSSVPAQRAATTFATFLVPASIRMLLAFAKERLASYADKIEMIETGAAPISQADMEQLCEVLPKSRLFNTYASTETGIVATYDFNHGECLAGCLGKPMKHSRLRIEQGRVVCSGKTLMSGYWEDGELTRSVLRLGEVFTSDLGLIDDQGRLRLQGRDGDVINVGGYKVSPVEVENVALSLASIKDCICIPAQHRVLGTVLKLLVVLHAGYALDKRQIAQSIRGKLDSYKVPMQYDQVECIKRTFNGKIDRKAYRG